MIPRLSLHTGVHFFFFLVVVLSLSPRQQLNKMTQKVMASTGTGPYLWSPETECQLIYCCVRNHHQTLWLKMTITYYVTVLWVRNLGRTQPGSSSDLGVVWGPLLICVLWMTGRERTVCAGLSHVPGTSMLLHMASPCGSLGVLRLCGLRLAGLQTSLAGS